MWVGVTPNGADRYRYPRGKTEGQAIKLYDERRLLMLVGPSGGKWWQLKYRVHNKEQLKLTECSFLKLVFTFGY